MQDQAKEQQQEEDEEAITHEVFHAALAAAGSGSASGVESAAADGSSPGAAAVAAAAPPLADTAVQLASAGAPVKVEERAGEWSNAGRAARDAGEVAFITFLHPDRHLRASEEREEGHEVGGADGRRAVEQVVTQLSAASGCSDDASESPSPAVQDWSEEVEGERGGGERAVVQCIAVVDESRLTVRQAAERWEEATREKQGMPGFALTVSE